MPGAPVDPQLSREQLVAFLKQLPVAVAMFDRQMRYLQASQRWCADYGLNPANLLGRSHYDVFPDAPERWKTLHQRGLAGEALREEEDLFQRADGRLTWLRWEIRPWGQAGVPEGILIFSEDITTRKLAEHSLRENEQWLRLSLEASEAGVWNLDLATKRVRWDSRSCELFGFPPEDEVDLETALSNVHPADRAAVSARMDEILRTPGDDPWDVEFRTVQPDGRTIWVNGIGRAERDERGQVVRMAGINLDVTSRRALEETLERANREYRDLVENIPDAILRTDPEGRLLFANSQLARLAGMPVGSRRGGRVEAEAAASGEPMNTGIRRVVESRQPVTIYPSFSGVAGEVFCQVRMVPELAPDGSVRSVLSIASDITAQVKTEERARRQEQELRERETIISTVFDTAAQAIFGVGEDGRIQLVNRMGEEMFGYERGELLGQMHEILLPEAYREAHAAHRAAYARAPRRRPMGEGIELTARRKDGSVFPVDVSLSHLQTARGLLVVSFVTDITRRKQQEQELRERHTEVRKLGVSLLTAQEDTARQIARELHDDITQRLAFLSIEIGHDASRPQVGEAQAAELHSYQARLLEISESVRRISHQMHPTILDDLGLSAALESLCLDLEHLGVANVHFEAHDVPAKVDPPVASCLYRVCQEALRNVWKHARADQVNVRLSGEGEVLRLSIVDNGVGFDTSRKANGLGTSSMRERVRLVHGTIAITSIPDRGSRVEACIPRKGTNA